METTQKVQPFTLFTHDSSRDFCYNEVGKSGNKGKFQAPVVKYLLCFNISWVIIVYTLWPYNVGKNATNKKEDEET